MASKVIAETGTAAGRKLTLTETEQGEYIMAGGPWGEHRIFGGGRERARAHWMGYLQNCSDFEANGTYRIQG